MSDAQRSRRTRDLMQKLQPPAAAGKSQEEEDELLLPAGEMPAEPEIEIQDDEISATGKPTKRKKTRRRGLQTDIPVPVNAGR